MIRRNLVQTLALAALVPCLAVAQSDPYPTRPVQIVVPFTPGQAGDVLSRALGEPLSKIWGKSLVVDNKPGAGGILGTQVVMRANPDGYTLLMGTSGPMAIVPSMNKAAGYDPRSDFTPVMLVGGVAQVLVVPAKSPYKTVADLVAAAKANPGKLSYGTGGAGSTQHLTMELLKQRAGMDMQHVPYKGTGPAYNDLLGGSITALFDSSPGSVSFKQGGQVRVLAVSTAKRIDSMPDVPTLAESGYPGFDVLGWMGVLAPAKLKPAVRDKINADLRTVLAQDTVKANLAKYGIMPIGSSPEEFGKFIGSEMTRWGDVIKKGGLTME